MLAVGVLQVVSELVINLSFDPRDVLRPVVECNGDVVFFSGGKL